MKDRTTEYAKLVVNGKKVAGRKEILACKRHLEDMKRKKFDYKFDTKAAERAIDIANSLTISEGEKHTQLKTRGFQNFIIGSLFGWKEKRTNKRRFREAYVQVGRQNGKSLLSGAIANYFATFGGYMQGRIFCVATKQDQANIVWDEIAKFIRADEELSELYRIREHERSIKSLITQTEIKSLGRDTKSLDGFRSILGIADELHAHPNNQMYKLIYDGQVNVDNSLLLAITTAGFNLNSFCYEHYLFCEKILEGLVEKESQFIFICELDKDDDIWDWKNWQKANPFLLFKEDGISPNFEKIKIISQKAIDAQEKQGQELTNFLTKTLNRWVTAVENQYLNLEHFKSCESDLTIEDMQGKKCFLGIDLSSGGDLTSIALVFPLENEKIYVYSHSFMPILRLEEHEKTDKAPYRIWTRQGLLTLTDGGFGLKTDYKYITEHIKELIQRYNLEIIEVGYDSHNASAYLSDLDFLGCDITEVKQSAKALNEATVDFRLSVEAKQVQYDKNNDLFKWSGANATLTSNSFGEIKIDKQSQKNRIDPIDAVIDAWVIMLLNKKQNVDMNTIVDDWLDIMG